MYSRLTPTWRSRFPSTLKAGMQPWICVGVKLFTRPFLPSPFSSRLFRKGLGTKLDIPVHNFNVSKLNCLLPMHAHNCCILHRLNVCAMQCTSHYIGNLHYIIKAGCRGERSKVITLFNWLTAWQRDKTDYLTPSCMRVWGNYSDLPSRGLSQKKSRTLSAEIRAEIQKSTLKSGNPFRNLEIHSKIWISNSGFY